MRIAMLLVAAVLAGHAVVSAQTAVTVRTPAGEVTVLADRLEQIGPDNLVVATGNVEITRGSARLVADRVELNRETGDAVASGRVIFYDGDDRLTGERIEYNYKTGTGVVHNGEARSAPYYRIGGERMERLGENVYHVRRGFFTTCEDDPPTWSFHAGDANADLNDLIYGTSGSFWLKDIPLIPWVPFFAAAIRRERQTGFLFPRFGSSSRKGTFAEIPFFWAISDSQDATFTLSGFTKRGVGGSLEYRYVLSADHRGAATGFLIKETVDGQDLRGWWGLKHEWTIAPRLVATADVNGVSDDLVLREYADRLYNRSLQRVESNVFLTRSWPTWNLVGSAFWYQDLTQARPVELHRLPEIRLDGIRQPVPGLPGFLYEVQSSGVNFVREVGSSGQRLDLHPRILRPISLDGVVTVTPFAGARLTAYDKTVTGSRLTNVGSITVETTRDDARVRRLLEVGADAESRASRVYALDGRGGFDALLHTIEPRVGYAYVTGWDTDRLPQWTDIDQLGKASLLTYSLTNRLFARAAAPAGTEGARWEFARLAIGQSYDFRRQDRPFGDVVGELIVNPNRIFGLRADTGVNVYGEGVQDANVDLSVTLPRVSGSVGTRYHKPTKVNFLQGSVAVELTRNVTGRVATNWDLYTDTFVENRIGFDVKFQCWAFGVEYVSRHRGEDEFRFALSLLGVGSPLASSLGASQIGGLGSRSR